MQNFEIFQQVLPETMLSGSPGALPTCTTLEDVKTLLKTIYSPSSLFPFQGNVKKKTTNNKKNKFISPSPDSIKAKQRFLSTQYT